MTLTVYTAPGCGACRATTILLKKRQLPYREATLDDPEIQHLIAEKNLMHAPVVRAVLDDGSEQVWDGCRPDRINALVE